ncbi:MAG: hypothetical protein ACNYPE_03345 [Candidatus Azotimanducaceae bacterium WSBS_2022_MAG_OTU7]
MGVVIELPAKATVFILIAAVNSQMPSLFCPQVAVGLVHALKGIFKRLVALHMAAGDLEDRNYNRAFAEINADFIYQKIIDVLDHAHIRIVIQMLSAYFKLLIAISIQAFNKQKTCYRLLSLNNGTRIDNEIERNRAAYEGFLRKEIITPDIVEDENFLEQAAVRRSQYGNRITPDGFSNTPCVNLTPNTRCLG